MLLILVAVTAAVSLSGSIGVLGSNEDPLPNLGAMESLREAIPLAGKPSLTTRTEKFTSTCSCYGKELPGSGPSARYFVVYCKDNNKQYECKYRGNPHKCGAYNKDQHGFYNQLLTSIGNNMCKQPFGIHCPARKAGYHAEMCNNRDWYFTYYQMG